MGKLRLKIKRAGSEGSGVRPRQSGPRAHVLNDRLTFVQVAFPCLLSTNLPVPLGQKRAHLELPRIEFLGEGKERLWMFLWERERRAGDMRADDPIPSPTPITADIPPCTYLEIANLKDGLWVGKMILLQVGIEARGWGAEVGDARGWGKRGRKQSIRDLGPIYTTITLPSEGLDMAPSSLWKRLPQTRGWLPGEGALTRGNSSSHQTDDPATWKRGVYASLTWFAQPQSNTTYHSP